MIDCRLENDTDYKGYENILCSCVKAAAEEENIQKGNVTIVFVPGERIRELNNNYYEKDAETDVLTFTAPEKERSEEEYLGEIVIAPSFIEGSVPEKEFKWELCHVAVHGMFHLIGIHHEDTSDGHKKLHGREKKIIDRVLS